MAEQDLHNRISLLQQSLKQTAQLIAKLAKTQSNLSTQPSSDSTDPGENEAGDSHASLAAEIHETLKQEEEELELLQQDVEDLTPAYNASTSSWRGENTNARPSDKMREYSQLGASCKRLSEELKLARSRFRRAQLQAKRNAELALQKEQLAYLADLQAAGNASQSNNDGGEEQTQSHSGMRNSLLNPSRRNPRATGNNTKEGVLLNATSDLTSSLRRTHDLLSSEVSRSRFAHDTLTSSNLALEELNKRYGTLDDLLSRSRGLLGSLLSSQKSDTWYLETALYILLGTMAWLLFRRLLYGPAWWLVWQPLRLSWTVISWLSGGLLSYGSAQRGVSVAETVSGTTYTAMPSAGNNFDERAPQVSTEVDTQSGLDEEGGRDNGNQSLSDAVHTVIDNTRTGSGNTAASATAQPDADGKEGASQGEEAKEGADDTQPSAEEQGEHIGQDEVRRADGTPLRIRDPVKEPPNPKKRMWEESPTGERRKDEL